MVIQGEGTMDRRAFTLIELLSVITIVTILAIIAVPSLFSGRLLANEVATIGTLRSIASAQSVFRQRQVVDQDGDGQGEYGFLRELAGAVMPRGGASVLEPPAISQTLGNVVGTGVATKSGYALVMFLPSGTGVPVMEPAGDFPGANPDDAKSQELAWACYAIPLAIKSTGNRAFVVNQQAQVYATANVNVQDYDLTNIAPLTANPNAAFEAGVENLTGRFAEGQGAAQDGGTWVPAS